MYLFSFIKHVLQNYYKKVIFDFNFHGNKKVNQNNVCNKL